MARLGDRWGCLVLVVFLLAPGLAVGYLLHSAVWVIVCPVIITVLMLAVAAIPSRRKITPQHWANELEKHLLGTEGPCDWDDTTSVILADQRLENLRHRLVPDFDILDTPKKREEFRRIIEALRRGEAP